MKLVNKVITILLFAGASIIAMRQPSMQERLKNAAYDGNIQEVRRLLNRGVKAAGSFALSEAAWAGHGYVCKLLIENGADVNEGTLNRDMNGETPLWFALQHGHDNVSKLLLENDADPNIATKDGTTVFMAGAVFCRGTIVRLMLTMIPLAERHKILAKREEIKSRINTAELSMKQSGAVAQKDIRKMIGKRVFEAEINDLVNEQIQRVKKMLEAKSESGKTAKSWADQRGCLELIPLLDPNNAETIVWLRHELEKNIRKILFTELKTQEIMAEIDEDD